MRLTSAVFVGACAWALWLVLDAIVPRDDTDPPGGRSGMALYTDNRTGCQYLRGGYFSSLTPRMDEMGEHICRNPVKERFE